MNKFNNNILKDQIIELTGYYSNRKYPYRLKRIETWDDRPVSEQPCGNFKV